VPQFHDPSQLRPLADAAELIRLRWAAVAGQLAAVGVTAAAGKHREALGLLVVVLIGAASNLVAARRKAPAPQPFLIALIGLDVLLLSAMLVLTGGALSPLIPLYVVYPVLGAILLQPGMAWANFALVMAAHASLLVFAPWGGQLAKAQAPVAGHVWGLFATLGVASPFLVTTLLRTRQALSSADRRLARARANQEQTARLTSLATLAAGAAHELATPLGTIAVVAGELARREGDPQVAQDGALIGAEVARCRRVLHELAADAGEGAGEQRKPVPIGDIIDLALDGYGDEIVVEMSDELAEQPWTVPPRLVAQALRRLLGNAHHASPPGATVSLRVTCTDEILRLEVADHGHGMSPEVLARATEPFFTTRQHGVGMGLGLWFVRSVAEHLGGKLSLTSVQGQGSTAVLTLPSVSPTSSSPPG